MFLYYGCTVNPCWDAGYRNDWKEWGCVWWFGLHAIVCAYSDGIGESSLIECTDVKKKFFMLNYTIIILINLLININNVRPWNNFYILILMLKF